PGRPPGPAVEFARLPGEPHRAAPLLGRPAFVYVLRRGSVVFAGEAGELDGRSGTSAERP
ncbi:hypothetical protein ACFSJI_30635, partial [Streptomyces calvus]